MSSPLARMLKLVRGRWRWARGHCPRCNRNLHAAFPCYMANERDCPVCQDETEADLLMWHQYRTLAATKNPVRD